MKKICTVMALLTLLLSNLLPVASVVRALEVTTTNVVIHKIKLDNLKGWPKSPNDDGTYSGADNSRYDGSQILDITKYFGQVAEELDGVTFTYWNVTKDQYESMVKNSSSYDTVDKVEAYLRKKGQGKVTDPTKSKQGVTVNALEQGYYWFVENFDSYASLDGYTLSDAAAVPFGLVLPAYKADGSRLETLHVYPKNTVTKPKIDKDFKGKANAENPNYNKLAEPKTVGDLVEYEIETIIPAKARYATAQWSDQMTEGLTLKKDRGSFTVMIGDQPAVGTDWELKATDKGFTLTLSKEGLKKVNGKDTETKVKISYSAILNVEAIIDVPESNDVSFHYGNNPTHGNTPIPTKPHNKKIKVIKKFGEGAPDSFPEGVRVIMSLYNANTGEKIKEAILTKEKPEHTFTDLDDEMEYKVVETAMEGYTAEYKKTNGTGEIEVVNWKENNPPPLTPEVPKVVTGGARFRKVEQELSDGRALRGDLGTRWPNAGGQGTSKGLEGAVFYVKNAKGEYLALKDSITKAKEQREYDARENQYQELVKQRAMEEEIQKAKAARDAAYRTASTFWTFQADKNNAYEVTSGENGYFHVYGLAYGQYKLEEKKAPEGYARLTEPVPFEILAESTAEVNIETKTDAGLKLINNKKITIPQTGGIGTAIFTAIGLSVMTFAFVAMRRNRKEDVA